MNAADSILASATPAPKGAEWIDAPQAAHRIGVSVRHVQRLAFEKWYAAGQARQVPGEDGRMRLQVRTDAHPRLSRFMSPDDLTVDPGQLTAAQRGELQRRMELYNGWLEARAEGAKAGRTERQATADYLQRISLDNGTRLTRETLFRWNRRFRLEGQGGLLDGRWKTEEEKHAGPGDDPFLDELKRLYLDKRQRSKKLCYDRSCDRATDEGWKIPGLRSACRFLEHLPIAAVALHRGGVESYKNTAANFIERDYTTLDANALWVSDHHRFDVMVRQGNVTGRPWLCAFQDVRSRMIVGWRIFMHDPNSDVILAAFRDGCMARGVPEKVYLDNGKDFDAEALQGETKAQRRRRRRRKEKPLVDAGVFGRLGVKVIHALPYNPQAKPIERFFGTVCSRFSVMFATYCGRSPEAKPDDLGEKLKRGAAPELRDFAAAFTNWLEEYHAAAHAGDGMDGRSPRDVFDVCLIKRRTLQAELADLELMKQSRPLKVQRNGVNWKGVYYGGRELASLLGKQVTIRIDDRDVSQVDVYSFPDDKFLVTARSNARLPFLASSQAVRDAMTDKKRAMKVAREYHAGRPRMADSLEDRMAANAARLRQEQSGKPALGVGASIVPVRSPLEDQLPAIRRAKGKTATGEAAPKYVDPLLSDHSASFDGEDGEEKDSLRMAVGAESAGRSSGDSLMKIMQFWSQRRGGAESSGGGE
jgi:putative transposase